MRHTPEALLRELPQGSRLWLKGLGNSMWPLLRSGDPVQVARCGLESVALGDIAVLTRAGRGLVAHVVLSRSPLRTASLLGVEDPPAELLGRVERVRTREHVLVLARPVRLLLYSTCRLAAIARQRPLLRRLWRQLRALCSP